MQASLEEAPLDLGKRVKGGLIDLETMIRCSWRQGTVGNRLAREESESVKWQVVLLVKAQYGTYLKIEDPMPAYLVIHKR